MGIVVSPSTCAECHRTEILNLHCKKCRLHYCDECARALENRCAVCGGPLDKRGFELF